MICGQPAGRVARLPHSHIRQGKARWILIRVIKAHPPATTATLPRSACLSSPDRTMVNGTVSRGLPVLVLFVVGGAVAFLLVGIPLLIGAWIWGLVDGYTPAHGRTANTASSASEPAAAA
jgi:hypothetical protein